MRVHASAPGKLVVAGDYAVLEGAPAVVLALDRRACVDLTASDDDTFRIDAADLGVHAVHGTLDDGHMRWHADEVTAGRLHLVAVVLEALACVTTLEPVAITLDTHAFFAGQGDVKLGFGSSAALTVALAGAMCAASDVPVPELGPMIAMHRQMQGGRGSGIDIAASFLGGALVYHLRDGEAQAVRATWPPGLALCCVWSGRAASTGAALARLAEWRKHHPAVYHTHMNELIVGASAVSAALAAGDAAAMVDGLAAYAGGLARLGDASGIDIVCAEHRALAQTAAACDVTYKTCGAGGGDVGIAVATDAERIKDFSRQATAAGFRVLEAGIDAHGLLVDASNTCKRKSSWTNCA